LEVEGQVEFCAICASTANVIYSLGSYTVSIIQAGISLCLFIL
jgi:hypothetical protein